MDLSRLGLSGTDAVTVLLPVTVAAVVLFYAEKVQKGFEQRFNHLEEMIQPGGVAAQNDERRMKDLCVKLEDKQRELNGLRKELEDVKKERLYALQASPALAQTPSSMSNTAAPNTSSSESSPGAKFKLWLAGTIGLCFLPSAFPLDLKLAICFLMAIAAYYWGDAVLQSAGVLIAVVEIYVASVLAPYPFALFACAERGSLRGVRRLVESQADINAAGAEGRTPLWTAAYFGHTNVVQYLVKKGAFLNKVGPNMATPLHAAAQKGHCDVVILLADVIEQLDRLDIMSRLSGFVPAMERATADGTTPLAAAACGGHVGVVHWLLQRNAGVDKADRAGVTPLMKAARGGHLDVVRCLTEAGAAVNKADRNGRTALALGGITSPNEILKYCKATGQGHCATFSGFQRLCA
eukprot:EG_transcript_14876